MAVRQEDGVLGVVIWCPSPEGQSQARSLARRAVRQPELLEFSGPLWFSQLALWLGVVSPEVRQSCLGAFFDPGRPQAPSLPLDQLIGRLQTPWVHEALSLTNLECHIQPILMLSDLTVCGFEALARSRIGPRFLSGFDLVKASEAHAMLPEFEVAALAACARDAAPQILENEMLFVNLLPSTIANPDRLERQVIAPLKSRGLSIQQVVFEMVETEQLPPPYVLQESLEVIRGEGGLLAIDDVGAGCAAFACIAQIEPDVVKLDRSLVHLEEATACGIIRSLAAAAHAVGALCVAEGIETGEQLEMVRAAQVDLAQGWLIGKPAKQAQRSFGGHAFVG